MDKFVIIDGNSLVNRAFYALPMLKTTEGENCNAVYGFVNMLLQVISKHNPKYIAVAFDAAKKTFRNDIFADYKANRTGMPDELRSQMPILKNTLKTMGIHCVEKVGIEADDIIGTLANRFDAEMILVSGDKDLFQLVKPNITIWFTKKGISQVINVDETELNKTFSITPKQVVDYKALAGDSSDNIPGVKGIGEKTALDLLEKYTSLDGVYENIEKISGKLQEKLIANKDMAYISKQLATIKIDCEIDCTLDDCIYSFPFKPEVRELFKKFDFKSLYLKDDLFSNVQESKTVSASSTYSKTIDIDTVKKMDVLFAQIQAKKECALHQLDGVWHIAVDEIAEYVVFKDIENSMPFISAFADICKDNHICKIVFDAKLTKHILTCYGVILNNYFDVSLAEYLTKQNDRVVKLEDILLSFNSSIDYVARTLFVSKENYLLKLKESKQDKLYFDVELKLVDVLFKMEQSGFKIDKSIVEELSKKYNLEMTQIENKIYELAGTRFNVKSPNQLMDVLFNKLGIEFKGKKSTNIDVLEKLYDKHEIIEYIIRYRKISKLVSTYLDGFIPYISTKTGKVHTTFLQSFTSTGRLSSREPNLQNIPVKDDESRALRKMFVSSFENGSIISADYNQIELRLMANFSKDENMIHDYLSGKDIHTATASKIFGVKESDVSRDMRKQAKAVNFGIIYGISDFGLGKNIGMSPKEAKIFIEKYFQAYPNVKVYMDSLVQIAKEKQYAETFMNRRRYLPEINSKSHVVRQFSERVAMNMPLQGGASDIIKLAMVKVQQELEKHKLKSKLILQIHDELIIDTHPAEVASVCKILKTCMENVVKFEVPLIVEVGCGKNWFESH